MPELYHYIDSGLPNVWLEGGVEVIDTPHGPATTIPDLDGLHHEIAMDIISSPNQMTGAEFRFLRIELDMSQRALADVIKTSVKNVQRWESDRAGHVPGPSGVAIGLLYAASKSDEQVRALVMSIAELDREMIELDERHFKLTDNHWEAA